MVIYCCFSHRFFFIGSKEFNWRIPIFEIIFRAQYRNKNSCEYRQRSEKLHVNYHVFNLIGSYWPPDLSGGGSPFLEFWCPIWRYMVFDTRCAQNCVLTTSIRARVNTLIYPTNSNIPPKSVDIKVGIKSCNPW